MSAVEELRKRLMDTALQANIAMGVAMAERLKLFPAIAACASEKSPAHFSQIAVHANLKPRYAKEILALLACADLVQVTPDGEHFFIRDAEVPFYTAPVKETALATYSMLPVTVSVFDRICKVMEVDGPLGMNYSDYTGFYHLMAEFSSAIHKKHLVPDFVPFIGMKDRLEEGLEFLDVGCGAGFHIGELATAFPRSHFTGIDLSNSAIQQCQKRKTEMRLENTDFYVMNANVIEPLWTDKFDLVTIFDACHDQCRPDLSLKEIYRVLKPDGLFAMVEIDGTSNVSQDKETIGMEAVFMYAGSVFHCLPVGSNQEDALALGTMMGRKKGMQLLTDAGFAPNKVEVKKMPFFEINILYLARK